MRQMLPRAKRMFACALSTSHMIQIHLEYSTVRFLHHMMQFDDLKIYVFLYMVPPGFAPTKTLS